MRRALFSLLLLAGLSACTGPANEPATGAADAAAPAEAAGKADESARLAQVVEGYYQDNLELNPLFATFVGDHRYNDRFANSIGPEHLAAQLALENKYLEALLDVDRSRLEGQDLLTWEIFERDRRDAIEGLGFPSQLIPINQFWSMPNLFAQLGSGSSAQPFDTVADYDNFLGRVDGFAVWMDQAIVNMREGIRRDIVRPRVIMAKVLPQLAAHVNDDVTATVFYRVIDNMPESFDAATRERLRGAYESAIAKKIVPAYRAMHEFIENEYLAAAPDEIAFTAMPGGEAWYRYLVRQRTTTDLTPDEIHTVGLNEVERIRGEMEAIRDEVGFEGDLRAFFDHLRADPQFYHDEPEQLLDSYRALKSTVAAAAPELFALMPTTDFEVRAVEPFREQSASGASYQRAAPDGSRPGIFYVNTYDLSSRPKYMAEALYLHEAVPGHHYQIALAQELDLPSFRRFGGYTAYVEGWGLYAETLGPELGLYRDPYQRFGALDGEMVRAIRLVVDTGMHARGWSREQALDFMQSNSSIGDTRAVSEVERYIAIPAQALAYKIGQLKISELRDRAAAALGDDFDLREFHARILEDGSLPLDVLEAKIDRWIATRKR